ncbi:MAG TPA: glycogen/starch/alpha-glucan phosphorylase [Desulfobulbus sp.]|nr:glycogen/starch/alpha-glucan phosphorylase [Desulfobulbus sp.]
MNADNSRRNTTTAGDIKKAFEKNLYHHIGKPFLAATMQDFYTALAYTVRTLLLDKYIHSIETYLKKETRVVAYFSAEFLEGPHLINNMLNLGVLEQARAAMTELGLDLDQLAELEVEPGLGNGGLGRLAACYLDSLATQKIPAIGYGLRYEHGMFEQRIEKGAQVEYSDNWLHFGNPWELYRPERTFKVQYGGSTESYTDSDGNFRVRWHPGMVVKGVPYDTPILGYRVNNCVLLRLWRAEAAQGFNFQDFNQGDYYGAVENKVQAENITKVLYPNDQSQAGKRLRLEQQYFLVSCSLQDLIHMHTVMKGLELTDLHRSIAAQLNDTHPSLAIPELMRLLVDVHHIPWDTAWEIVQKTFSYTNHTLLPEALERWQLSLFQNLLPRHYEIVCELNRRFLDQVRKRFPLDNALVADMSLIEEGGEKYVRMANLACLGSSHINGVARLHTQLLKKLVLRDCHRYWPDKILNITNGVTPRRWIGVSNPGLTALITEAVGEGWLSDLEQLADLEPFADDSGFQDKWYQVKRAHKEQVADLALKRFDLVLDPDSMFDVQVKRIHEYKRQHLNILHVIGLYLRLKNDPSFDMVPRTIVFGGKAAPGYFMAKLIIRLINSVAEVINADHDTRDRIKVVFRPNYNVKIGQIVYPMADLSEQISLAGMEASGTGNMKFAMNGALTIGTLDGANVEIREEVGEENFFLFGLTSEEVLARKTAGYRPAEYYDRNEELCAVFDLLASGCFSHGDTELFRPLLEELQSQDTYMLCADFASYVDCQRKVDAAYRDRKTWVSKSILTVARTAKFSSDRAIREYCRNIWQVEPVEVVLPT